MDFLMACQKAQHMVASVEHTIDIWVDLSSVRSYPTSLMYLIHTGIRMRTQNTGKVIVVTESKMWSRLYQHFIQIYPMDALPIEFVGTEEKISHKLRLIENNGKLASTCG